MSNYRKLCNQLLVVFLSLCISSAAHAKLFSNYSIKRVQFESGSDALCGTLVLPKGKSEPAPLIIFVHGDGATPHDAWGAYHYLWEALAKRGIASFSWDKPGVGDSSGNWLSQSMDDRAAEVVAAFQYLEQTENVNTEHLGVIGFSQAGWVLPRLANEAWVDFMIFVSPAVNWIAQGKFITKKRLSKNGQLTDQEFNAVLEQVDEGNALILDKSKSYSDYVNSLSKSNGGEKQMTQDRFEFVRKNIAEDSTLLLSEIKVPVLALFGADDLNIDVENSTSTYRKAFNGSNNTKFDIRVFEDATHGITKSRYFNVTVPGLREYLKMVFLGDDLFAEGYLSLVAEFSARASSVDNMQ